MFHFVFQMSRCYDAPPSPALRASRPPPPLASESLIRAIPREEDGMSTPELSPRSAKIVAADLARCTDAAGKHQLQK